MEILECEHPGLTYTVTADTHLPVCPHCLTGFEEEAHAYDEEDQCTVCGYPRGGYVFSVPDFTLPADIRMIGAEAFEGVAMTVVLIPDGCESIGDAAFRDCQGLTQIRIPASVANIGADIFEGCGRVLVFCQAGSPAETYCTEHDNCVFVQE